VGASSLRTFLSCDDVSDEGAGAVGIEPRGDVGGITITRHDVGQRSTGGDAFAGQLFRASSSRTFLSCDDVSDEGAGAVGIEPRGDVGGITIIRRDVG